MAALEASSKVVGAPALVPQRWGDESHKLSRVPTRILHLTPPSCRDVLGASLRCTRTSVSSTIAPGGENLAGVLKNARTRPATLPDEPDCGVEEKDSIVAEAVQELLKGSQVEGKLKVAVLLSGGVDSSVALRLLCLAGYDCSAYYLKIWFQEDFENFWSACPWEEDLKYAQDVCDKVGVDLNVVHLTDDYWAKVVSHSIAEIKAGRTPNPDILCNTRIKFGSFFDHIDFSQYDMVASGHYARVERNVDSSGHRHTLLKLSADELKDQTYFLSHLSQAQLSKLIFPLGTLSKPRVRKLADAMNLPNKQRKDSQGICFLGKVRFSEFIAKHLGEKVGRIVEAESGVLLGNHNGFWFYTIGQRHGLRLPDGPWFVVAKDVEHNVIFVSKNYYAQEKQRSSFGLSSLNWLSGYPPDNFHGVRCKVRHGPRFYSCTVEYEQSGSESPGDSSAIVRLSEDDQGLAPGQFAALYAGDTCLGSGVIAGTLDGCNTSNVSEEAVRAAMTGIHPERKKVVKVPKGSSENLNKRRRQEDVETERPRSTISLWQAVKEWALRWLSR